MGQREVHILAVHDFSVLSSVTCVHSSANRVAAFVLRGLHDLFCTLALRKLYTSQASWNKMFCSTSRGLVSKKSERKIVERYISGRDRRLDLESFKRSPLEVRVTSGQKPSTKITDTLYCILRYDCFQYLLKKIISSNTKRRKRMLNFLWNTWKYWWNENDDEIWPV